VTFVVMYTHTHAIMTTVDDSECNGVGELECYAYKQCQPFASTFWTQYLIWFRYTSYLISVLLLGYGLKRRQVLAVALVIGLVLDSALNMALKHAFAQPPPVLGCGRNPYAMPSFQTEHTAFFLVGIAMYPLAWYVHNVRTAYIGGFVAFYLLVVTAQLYFNFNSPAQVLAGAAFGSLFSWLWGMCTIAFAYPYFDTVLESSLVVNWYPMNDTLGIALAPAPGDPPPTYVMYTDDEPLAADDGSEIDEDVDVVNDNQFLV